MIYYCNRPPEGWYCTLPRDHIGPCAAWPVASEVVYSAKEYNDAIKDAYAEGYEAAESSHYYDVSCCCGECW